MVLPVKIKEPEGCSSMRTKKLTLVVVPVLLTACSGSKTLQQDVYNNQYNCYQDWHFELCEPLTKIVNRAIVALLGFISAHNIIKTTVKSVTWAKS